MLPLSTITLLHQRKPRPSWVQWPHFALCRSIFSSPSPSPPPLLLLFLHSEISTIYISVRSINLFPHLRATRAFTKFLWSRCQLFTFVFQNWDGSSYFVAVKTDCHLDDQLLLIQYIAHEYQRHINSIIYSTHIYLYIKRRFRGILFSNWYMTRFYIHNYRLL